MSFPSAISRLMVESDTPAARAHSSIDKSGGERAVLTHLSDLRGDESSRTYLLDQVLGVIGQRSIRVKDQMQRE